MTEKERMRKTNYPKIDTWPVERLQREYLDMTKASFDRVFGHNAKVARSVVAEELLKRGETTIPNIFGDIEVKP